MVRHTSESRYPGFFIFSAGPGFLLEFTPMNIGPGMDPEGQ